MSKGRRYDGGQKLNVKKVFAVIIAIAVIIMFIVGIGKLLKTDKNTEEKVVATKYYAVYTNDKWGVIDSKGNTIIEPTYDETIIIPDNTKPVFICTYDVNYNEGTYKTKVLNNQNQEIYTEYEAIEGIENYDSDNNLWYEKNVLKVKKDGKYGLIDIKGKQIVNNEYDSIVALKGTSNSLITTKDGKKGLIDNTGAVIIENEYKDIKAISDKYENGYIVQNSNNKYGVINWSKTIALEPKYDNIKPLYGNGEYYVVSEDGKWEIVDIEGNTYLKGQFDDIKTINNNNAIIKKDNKYGIMSIPEEKAKVETKYEDITYATGTNYIIKENNKCGIINEDGTKVLDTKYTNIVYRDIANFYEATNEDYTSDILNANMEVKLTGIISEVNLTAGYMKVRVGEEYKYYNFKFEEKESKDILKNNTLFLSKKDGKYGYVNKHGIVIVDYIYDDANEQNEYGYASVKKDGLWGCINSKGSLVIEPQYDLENNILVEFIGKWHLAEDLNLYYFTDK